MQMYHYVRGKANVDALMHDREQWDNICFEPNTYAYV